MHSDIKQLWVEALRSGEYIQDRGQLRSSRGYCCLGVLCDLYDPAGWATYGHSYDEAMRLALPENVAAWAGIMNDPYFISNSPDYADFVNETRLNWIYLTSLNDDARMSFAAIADVIEREF
jgi:hypothetical protein